MQVHYHKETKKENMMLERVDRDCEVNRMKWQMEKNGKRQVMG
jgi:hypothetical protein